MIRTREFRDDDPRLARLLADPRFHEAGYSSGTTFVTGPHDPDDGDDDPPPLAARAPAPEVPAGSTADRLISEARMRAGTAPAARSAAPGRIVARAAEHAGVKLPSSPERIEHPEASAPTAHKSAAASRLIKRVKAGDVRRSA